MSDAKTRILVVDDDAASRKLLTAALSVGGAYEVVSVKEAEEALGILASDEFQLMITDLEFPTISGIDLIAHVRAHGIHMPVLVLATTQTEKTIAEALAAGADDYLQKPVDLQVLRKSVTQLLNRKPKEQTESERAGTREPETKADLNGHAEPSEKKPARSSTQVRLAGDGTYVELTAPSDPVQMERFQRFAERLLATALTEKERSDLKQALEQTLRNAMDWGKNCPTPKKISLSYCILYDRVTFRIQDEGSGFNNASLGETDDSEKHSGPMRPATKTLAGWGVFSVRDLVDEITYNRAANVVFLTKYIQRASQTRIQKAVGMNEEVAKIDSPTPRR